MNVEMGTMAAQLPRKGIHKWDFRCSVSFVRSAGLSPSHTLINVVQYKSPSGGVSKVGPALFSLVISDFFVPSIAAAVVSVVHVDDDI
jgi:hypothetical protein